MKKVIFIILLVVTTYLFSYAKEEQHTMIAPKIPTKTEKLIPQPLIALKRASLMPSPPLEVRDTRPEDVQSALMIIGYYEGPIDGKMGSLTKKAIRDFQRDNNLQVDGKVGPKTWAVLRVKMIQKTQTALKNVGYYTAEIDGKMGPLTKKAIRDFQRDNNLQVDGKVGPKTWDKLSQYLNDLMAKQGCLSIYNKIYEIMDKEYYKDVSREKIEKFKDEVKKMRQDELVRSKYDNAIVLVNRLKNHQEDNYSWFFPPPEAKKFEQIILGSELGLGIDGQMIDNRGFKVTRVEPRSDSFKQGIRENDIIIKINGEPVKRLTNDQIIEKLHLTLDAKVDLTIISHQDNQEKELVITCTEFIKKEVFLRKNERPNIFCIEIKSFNEKLFDDLNEIFNDLRTKPISGIILDFRGNQGGELEFKNNKGETINIIENLAGYFIAPGNRLYYVITKSQGLTEFFSKKSDYGGLFYSIPLIGLMNEKTASTTELILGVLKTYNRIILVGQNSQGAGYQKRIWNFIEDGKQSSLELVTSPFYLSDANTFYTKGLKPDYEILDSEQAFSKAIDILVKRKGGKRNSP